MRLREVTTCLSIQCWGGKAGSGLRFSDLESGNLSSMPYFPCAHEPRKLAAVVPCHEGFLQE